MSRGLKVVFSLSLVAYSMSLGLSEGLEAPSEESVFSAFGRIRDHADIQHE